MSDVPFPRGSKQAQAAKKVFGIIKRLKALPKISPMGEAIRDELDDVYKLLSDELPGIPEKARPARFCKPTHKQVMDYAATQKIEQSDADWFFFKCQGNGWKNDGKAIVDWQSTMRAWFLARVFPSQKQKGSTKTIGQKDLDSISKRIDKSL